VREDPPPAAERVGILESDGANRALPDMGDERLAYAARGYFDEA
jgi:hypothetical protein